jgi:ribose 5-phosphate isomerase A
VKDGLRIRAIATSLRSETLARELDIPIISFADVQSIDLTIDGADEVDPANNLVKGGGGSLLREKIVAAASRTFIVVVDESKLVPQLGAFPLPVEVVPFGWEVTAKACAGLGCTPTLRMADSSPSCPTTATTSSTAPSAPSPNRQPSPRGSTPFPAWLKTASSWAWWANW